MAPLKREDAVEYERLKPTLEALQREAEFALQTELARDGLKVHLITGRVKKAKDLAEKAERKNYTHPLEDAMDLVGVRVVVLFLADLARVESAATRLFEVLERDDKVEPGDPSLFGYMSIHLLARLKEEHAGPRYDQIKGRVFEIQIRTIVMDAWANVSHYLGYKGTASVPQELRRDFLALSGLFYVADQHFELFFKRSVQSEQAAAKELQTSPTVDTPRQRQRVRRLAVNASTVTALLSSLFPDRAQPTRGEASQLTEELTAVGYSTLPKLHGAIVKGLPAFQEYERGQSETFAALAAVRLALAHVDARYSQRLYGTRDIASYLAGLDR